MGGLTSRLPGSRSPRPSIPEVGGQTIANSSHYTHQGFDDLVGFGREYTPLGLSRPLELEAAGHGRVWVLRGVGVQSTLS